MLRPVAAFGLAVLAMMPVRAKASAIEARPCILRTVAIAGMGRAGKL